MAKTPYSIHVAPTGFERQHRIIVMKETICGVCKWDDVLTPSARCAGRRLREMRAEYRVPRVKRHGSPSALSVGIWI